MTKYTGCGKRQNRERKEGQAICTAGQNYFERTGSEPPAESREATKKKSGAANDGRTAPASRREAAEGTNALQGRHGTKKKTLQRQGKCTHKKYREGGRRKQETHAGQGSRADERGGGGTTANAQRHDQDMTKGLTLGLVTTPDGLRGPAHLRRRQTPTAPYVGTLSARLRVASGGAGPLRERRWVGAPSTRPTILLAPPAAFPPPPCARSEVP